MPRPNSVFAYVVEHVINNIIDLVSFGLLPKSSSHIFVGATTVVYKKPSVKQLITDMLVYV